MGRKQVLEGDLEGAYRNTRIKEKLFGVHALKKSCMERIEIVIMCQGGARSSNK